MIRKTLALLIVVATISSCGQKSDTIASVGKRDISQSQFDAYLKLKRIPLQNTERVAAALDEYLSREALADGIEAAGLLDLTTIEADLNEYKKQLLISRYFEQYLNEQASEQAIRNYYAVNADEFSTKKLHVAHILVRTSSVMGDREKQARLSKAHQAYTEIMQGKDFADVAERYSEDQRSAKKGGDLGWITNDAVDPVFIKAANTLKQGEVSTPVASNFGYHIIKLLEPEKTVKTAFVKVKGDIRYKLRQSVKQAEMERLSSSIVVKKH